MNIRYIENRLLATFGIGLCMIASPAFAQQAEPVASEAEGGIEDIVVTARRTAERAQNVPIAITTVTAEGLSNLSVRDIIEVQKVTPGLYMSSQNSAGRVKVTIRGQSEADSRLTTDPSVGIYIDGVNFLRSYGLRSSFVDLAQVEVLKGPQGTLFGKNTTGGAINITTQQPKYEAGGYVDLLYGSYNNMQALAVVNLPLVEDKLAIRAVGQVIHRDGYGTQNNKQDIGDDNVVSGRLLIRADPSDSVHILLSGDYVRQRNNGTNVVLTYDAMLTAANSATGGLGEIAAELGLNRASAADRLTAYNRWRAYYDAYQNGNIYSGFEGSLRGLFDNVDHWGVSADVSLDVGEVNLRSITSYRHLTRAYEQGLDGTPFDLLDVYLTTRQHNFSQELRASSIDQQGLDWQVGVFYNLEKGNEFSNNNTNRVIRTSRANINDTDSTNSSVAGYAQAVYNFSDNFRMTGGLRYTDDYREITSHNRIDPRPEFALPPYPSASVGVCNLLTPTLGGPTFPNCSYTAGTHFKKLTWLASMDYRPVNDVLLYASVSKGYRAGGYTAQASGVVQPSVAALNAAFTPYRPEQVVNYEVGFKSDILDRRVRLNGSFYYQDYSDIQGQIRDVVNGVVVTLIRNAARAKLYGGELELTIAPYDTLLVNASTAYLHARYDEFMARDTAGNLLDLSNQAFPAPAWTFNIGATKTIPLADGELRLFANYSWTDDVIFRPDTPNLASVTQKAYGILDARISWHIASQDLDIAVFGKNLTDIQYFTAATNLQATGFNVAFPGDPRTFGVQLRKTF